MNKRDELLNAALSATREGRGLEFKEAFFKDVPGAWCELLKDIAAIANSGGGIIIIGLDSYGAVSGWDPAGFLVTDPADIVNTFAKYLGEQFDEFEVLEVSKAGTPLAAVFVQERRGAPLVFEKPGTYPIDVKKQKTAFASGTVYFRHGAKSEPSTSRDLSRFVGKEVARVRTEWLKNVRKLVSAPPGSMVSVAPIVSSASSRIDRFRIVDDPDAPAMSRTDFDKTHPYRQKELLLEINKRTGDNPHVSPYDLQCLRKVHEVDARREFFHQPKFGSPQYSDALLSWIMTELQRDKSLFSAAKNTLRVTSIP